ncbi:MAG: molybdenum cofactor guanylyltransferase [Actinomycetota bacterium]|nr:molybdenum cofactor guanylyltransferase [Actinomycetota bacterium]
MSFDALVLSGGRGTRLGGIDKGDLEIGGKRLIDRVLEALAAARRIVVVGPPREVGAEVLWTREEPAGGGPVAGLAAGLTLVEEEVVVVLAVDMPFVTESVVARLVTASTGTEGAILRNGGDQYLCGAYVTEALRARLRSLKVIRGASMRRLLEGLSLARVRDPSASWDCDTWEQVERARSQEGG